MLRYLEVTTRDLVRTRPGNFNNARQTFHCVFFLSLLSLLLACLLPPFLFLHDLNVTFFVDLRVA